VKGVGQKSIEAGYGVAGLPRRPEKYLTGEGGENNL